MILRNRDLREWGDRMVCAFTGHRPERLPWGGDETDARCAALRHRMEQVVTELHAQGFETFLCGMARGCDTLFAESVLAVQRRCPELRLVAMIPCPSQPDAWPEADRARYSRLLAACSEVRVLEASYSDGCMLRRNRTMADAAALLVTVYDGGPGGTAATIRYARQKGKQILPLWY